MATAPPRPKLLVIVGETASGKSALALKIARQFNGEIIAADSWTVYKGFNVGTSKPSVADQKIVPHHMLDIADAAQGFNAPQFKTLAEAAIEDIQNRGKLPVMVGGTGLYIDSVLYNFGFLPNVGAHKREELNKMSVAELIELASVQKIDLSGIDMRNKRRIIRAIEAGGQKPTKKALLPGTLIVGLQIDTEELRKRAEQRTAEMIDNGLEQEVKTLSARNGWDTEPMKGIGYQQWRAYFAGAQSLDETKQKIISATMNLAKRQRTWFKRSQDIRWFSSADQAFDFIKHALNT